jgi:hypothetical protein
VRRKAALDDPRSAPAANEFAMRSRYVPDSMPSSFTQKGRTSRILDLDVASLDTRVVCRRTRESRRDSSLKQQQAGGGLVVEETCLSVHAEPSIDESALSNRHYLAESPAVCVSDSLHLVAITAFTT